MKPQLVAKALVLLLLLFCCCNQAATVTDKAIYLYEDSLHTLTLADSAYIHISYPQGTAFHQYQLTDSAGLTIITQHQKHPGNPTNSGGSMGETFYLHPIKTGQTILRLTDVSAGALQAARDTSSNYRNYRNYPIKITAAN
jgi:hypothetical protein